MKAKRYPNLTEADFEAIYCKVFSSVRLVREERKTIQGIGMRKANEIIYSMDKIETSVSDGEYDLYSSLEEWSDTKITVRDNLVDMDTCTTAVIEILEKSGYHGVYVDQVGFEAELKGGSFYVWIGS